MKTTVGQIHWLNDFDRALNDAQTQHRNVLLDFTAAPMWGGCARLEAEVYSKADVSAFIDSDFIPVRVHVREQADEFKRLGARYSAQWTPTVLIVDEGGVERHRIEGFLPANEFIAQLKLGLAQAAFARSDFAEAERQFREVVGSYGDSDAAPEALYWAGVAKYKTTGDAAALADTYKAFQSRYKDTSWATKASVWQQ
jgi:thioredoxin-related protein